MTRTLVRGDVSDAIAELHALVLTAHERSLAAVRPGIRGVELYGIACEVFEAAGHPDHGAESLTAAFHYGLEP